MELTQVIQILNDSKNQKQNEIAVLDLVLSALNNNFAPELQVLENARKEAEQKDIIIAEKDTLIAEKEIEINNKNSIIEEKQAEIDELKAIPLEISEK